MNRNTVNSIWKALFGDSEASKKALNEVFFDLDDLKKSYQPGQAPTFSPGGLVYSTYADAFGKGLDGVADQLPRLQDMGVTILWLLPLLDSPGRDQGFDIKDYEQINPLFGGNAAMDRLLTQAQIHKIQIIFDVAINHSSDEHPWFQQAQESEDSPHRSFYHWAKEPSGFSQTSLIFQGLVNSNWTWNEKAQAWYFHRFYPFQPDLNYTNPQVARQMIRALTHWKARGINGFRMDAAALLWKEEGTNCENRPQVHLILKLFRACLDYLAPHTLLLAEVNIPAHDLKVYFGDGDECRGAYHFEMMPRFYQAILEANPQRLLDVNVPDLPAGCSWFTFLRCHDEVTLDVLPEEERAPLVSHYAKDPVMLFRNGQAFSGRLFDIMDQDPAKTLLAWSLLFSMPGTPIIYYGDEFAMENNRSFFEEKSAQTGFRDSRFLNRGPFDYSKRDQALGHGETAAFQVWQGLKRMLEMRKKYPELFQVKPALSQEGTLLISRRTGNGQTLELVSNLAPGKITARGKTWEAYEYGWKVLAEN